MVAAPADYPWSSYGARMEERGSAASHLDLDPMYLALGESEVDRRERYGKFVRGAIPEGEWELIRGALQRGQLTGNARFTDEVERIVGHRIELRGQGRPRKRVMK